MEQLEGILNGMPEEQSGEGTPEVTAEATQTDSTQTPVVTETEDPAAAEQEEEPALEQVLETESKRNAAFYQMRKENKTYADTLLNLAKVMGAPPGASAQDAIDLISKQLIEFQAQQQQLPPQVMQYQHELEKQVETQAESKQLDEIKTEAYKAFQRIKDTYKLEQSQLNDFAKKLLEKGLRPLEEPVNLDDEYKLIYFDQLQQSAIANAQNAAKEQANKTANHSTAPTMLNGGSVGAAGASGGMATLEALLARMPGN